MNMKLSYRDKVVFIVVIVIIILVAGFMLFVKPKFEEIDVAKYDLEAVQSRKDEIDAKIATLPDIIDNIKEIAKDVGEKQEIFLDEQDPYLNETYVRDALSNQNLEYLVMTTAYTTASTINRYTVNPAHILTYTNKMETDLYHELPEIYYDRFNDVPPETYPNTILGVTNMTFAFKSDADFRTAYNVIDRLATDEKTIVLNTISCDLKNEVAEDREVSIALTMYSILPLNVDRILEEETGEVKPLETPAE
ncbi:MAG: hypothetical protein J1E40_04540 [Oscillospiraceae bacterium]|nr:hypothetical protein [Oscillospiraceae bacterium]